MARALANLHTGAENTGGSTAERVCCCGDGRWLKSKHVGGISVLLFLSVEKMLEKRNSHKQYQKMTRGRNDGFAWQLKFYIRFHLLRNIIFVILHFPTLFYSFSLLPNVA